MKDKEGLCPVCGYPLEEDVCCPECGHDCLLEKGELYCPVCRPEPEEKKGIELRYPFFDLF